jgi:hypothetical protein
MLGIGAATAVTMAVVAYTGGIKGRVGSEDQDRVEEKWEAMERYRNPVEETIAELGEGRGAISSTTNTSEANIIRYIWTGLPRAQARAITCEIWRRCWCSTGGKIGNEPHFPLKFNFQGQQKTPPGDLGRFRLLYICISTLLSIAIPNFFFTVTRSVGIFAWAYSITNSAMAATGDRRVSVTFGTWKFGPSLLFCFMLCDWRCTTMDNRAVSIRSDLDSIDMYVN